MKIKIFISIFIIAFISGLALSVDPVSAKKKSKGSSEAPKEMSEDQKKEIEKIKKDYTVYEAEEGEVEDCVIQDEHKGFSGGGYVNFEGKADATLEIKVDVKEEKEYKVLLRYALGNDARKIDISVNGEVIYKSYKFEGTEEWNDYITVEIEMELKKGENKILFTTTGEDGPNIDLIGIKK